MADDRDDPVGDFLAACIDQPDAARRLAAADPSLPHATRIGSPLLHWCVIEDFPSGAATLLSLGVDVDSTDDTHRTPLHYACVLGRLGCARRLLAAGADPNRYNDHFGENPLSCAVRARALDVVLLLLDHGARADYVFATTDTIFGAMQDWQPAARAELVDELARRGVTRASVFAQLSGYGFESAEQAFGW
ncbi:MAG: ankyrin repeat domain-containing protein [Planctomycetes bacterium]|nr:ankyrin repeat domain-containing protein [Planctomycetota bacterium]